MKDSSEILLIARKYVNSLFDESRHNQGQTNEYDLHQVHRLQQNISMLKIGPQGAVSLRVIVSLAAYEKAARSTKRNSPDDVKIRTDAMYEVFRTSAKYLAGLDGNKKLMKKYKNSEYEKKWIKQH